MLEAMDLYWQDHPPLHLMVAAYLGIKPRGETSGESLEQLSEFVPVATIGADEWTALMDQHGLTAFDAPTGDIP